MRRKKPTEKILTETETEVTIPIQFETNYFNCNSSPVEFPNDFCARNAGKASIVENLINFVENINSVINDVRYVKRPIHIGKNSF